jgi:hypothetical protein
VSEVDAGSPYLEEAFIAFVLAHGSYTLFWKPG